jgi:hypothetical protein
LRLKTTTIYSTVARVLLASEGAGVVTVLRGVAGPLATCGVLGEAAERLEAVYPVFEDV